MDRIINLIEAELRRQEEEISLLKWQIEDLQKERKEMEKIIREYERRKAFNEVANNGSL